MRSILLALIGMVPLGFVTYQMWVSQPSVTSIASAAPGTDPVNVQNTKDTSEANAGYLNVLLSSDSLTAIKRDPRMGLEPAIKNVQVLIQAYDVFRQSASMPKINREATNSDRIVYYEKMIAICQDLATKSQNQYRSVDATMSSHFSSVKESMIKRKANMEELVKRCKKMDDAMHACEEKLLLYNTLQSYQSGLRSLLEKVNSEYATNQKYVSEIIKENVLGDYQNKIALMQRAIQFREEYEHLKNVSKSAKVSGLQGIVSDYKIMKDHEKYSFKSMYQEIEKTLEQAQFDLQLERIEEVSASKELNKTDVERLLKLLRELDGYSKLRDPQQLDALQKQLNNTLSNLFINPEKYKITLNTFVEYNNMHQKRYKAGLDGMDERLSECHFEIPTKDEPAEPLLKNTLVVGKFKRDRAGDKISSLRFEEQVKDHYLGQFDDAKILDILAPWSCIKPAAEFQRTIRELFEQNGRMLEKKQWKDLISIAKKNKDDLTKYLEPSDASKKSSSFMIPSLRNQVTNLNDYYTHVINCAEAFTREESNWKLFESFFKTTSANNP